MLMLRWTLVLAKNLFHYLQGFFMAFVHQSVTRSFRNRLFEKYQSLSLGYFHRRRTGQVISRVTNDVTVLNEAIDIGFNRLVTDSVMAIVLTSFLLILSWKLTLLSMVIMPVVFGFIWFIGRKLRKYSARSQEKMADVATILEEIETLPENHGLYVHHKRIPQFLLPELKKRGYSILSNEIDEENLNLIIYK